MVDTLTKLLAEADQRFDGDIAPMITDYGGISKDPELEKQIKNFLHSEIKRAVEETRMEWINNMGNEIERTRTMTFLEIEKLVEKQKKEFAYDEYDENARTLIHDLLNRISDLKTSILASSNDDKHE